MADAPYYLSVLQGELARRCQRNPRYSLRAFAKSMQMDPGACSRILSRKMHPTPQLAQKMVQTLDLGPVEERSFWQSIVHARESAQIASLPTVAEPLKQVRMLDAEAFQVIGDWYHYAILEMTFVRGFKSDPRAIAAELGISPLQAKMAVERLLELGLLRREGRTLVKTDATLDTADQHVTTPALRRRQKQILEKAIVALEDEPLPTRSHTAFTMAIDPKRLPEAKKRIAAFRDELALFLEAGDRTRVYELSIALFPLQKKRSPQQ